MWKPEYENGVAVGAMAVVDGHNLGVRLDSTILNDWLKSQNKTLKQWLAENPYQPWGAQTLQEHAAARAALARSQYLEALAQRYDQFDLMGMLGLLSVAIAAQNTAAITRLLALQQWTTKDIYAAYYAVLQQCLACQTHEDIEKVTWDVSVWLANDPKVTGAEIGGLMQ